MIGLDTSAVLRLLTGTPALQAEAARALVEAHAGEVLVSDLVVSETYFALLHHYDVDHRDAVGVLLSFLEDSRVQATGSAPDALRQMGSRTQPGLVDRMIQLSYLSEGAEVHTFDRAMGRLDGARLIL